MLYGYLNSPFVSNPFSDAAIPPTSLTFPVVSGSGVVGQTLSTTNGTWSGTLPITYSYQWNRNGSEILGATFNTYTLVTADASASITCTVTATNAGGFASSTSNAISVAAAGDADANAFIAAAAITDTTQKAAIDKLVVDLKGYGIWTKMKAIYPFIGGTAAQHKFNLRSPLDTDTAFRLVFNGGWTHSSTGAMPNGTNAYADTKCNPFLNLSGYSQHISMYSRTQNTSVNGVNMGVFVQATQSEISLFQYYSAVSVKGGSCYEYPTYAVAVNNTNTLGLQVVSRTANNSLKLHFNGSLLQTNTNVETKTRPNANIFIGANNFFGTTGPTQYTPHQTAFNSIGDGLTDTEAANYYTAVQTFQTTLGRNV